MGRWRDVTESFSEEQRHYKNTYLEIDEVYDEAVEVSLFSSESEPYEIYISYGKMHGIIYTNPEAAEVKREEVKKVLAEEYERNNDPTAKFINEFCKKYEVQLPMDIFFDASDLFGFDI